MKENVKCFCCNSEDLIEVLDLGQQPLANSYPKTVTDEEKLYPLKLNFCNNCTHLQLSHTVDPDELFKNYVYLSGTSNTLNEYFKSFVELCQNYTKGKKILDIACNDGTQLNYFHTAGYDTYGIDPAENLYKISSRIHKVQCSYFDRESMVLFNEKFDVITAQNVFAHNNYPREFLEVCRDYLNHKGRIFIQTSQANMIFNGEFDTIYHEHLSFFTVRSFCTLARSVGLKVIDVIRVPVHGTSFVFVLSNDDEDEDLSKEFIELEERFQPVNLAILREYKERILYLTNEVSALFDILRSRGIRTIGFGAAAKGNTFLNFSGMKLDYIVDDNSLKQGLYTPGSKIQIHHPDKIAEEKSHVVVVPLAWNFFDEIKSKVLKKKKDVMFVRYFPKFEIDASVV